MSYKIAVTTPRRLPGLELQETWEPTTEEVRKPFHCEVSNLWFYGNLKLLDAPLATIPMPGLDRLLAPHTLWRIEQQAEELVHAGRILVCGVHNRVHRRISVVPLRWGTPRIVVFPGGFHCHLGEDLLQEAFAAARKWRIQWDPLCDLAVSRRAPEKRPTYASFNPTVDRLITRIANGYIAVPGGLLSSIRHAAPS